MRCRNVERLRTRLGYSREAVLRQRVERGDANVIELAGERRREDVRSRRRVPLAEQLGRETRSPRIGARELGAENATHLVVEARRRARVEV